MTQPMDPSQDDPQACFEDFYRHNYRLLITVVLAIGGTLEEAHDSVSDTMEEMWRRWSKIDNAGAYARKAVVNNFIKYKERVREGLVRAVEGGHLSPESHECPELTAWEDKEWLDQIVCSLPRAQREVVEAIFDGLMIEQISTLFGRKPTAIRRCLERATRSLVELRKERYRRHGGGAT